MNYITNGIACVSIAFLGLVAGCSKDPANVAGDYSMSVKNGKNECQFLNFNVGDTTQNIQMKVTQSGSDIEADFGGSPTAALVLDLVLANHKFTGTVDGSDIDLSITGARSLSKGNCAYTINARATGNLQGDLLQGTIEYTSKTNGNPDCGTLEGCVSEQDFNGTRPPGSGS